MPPTDHPAWTQDATAVHAFLRGLVAATFSIAGLVLTATGLGYGALAHDLGYTFGHMWFINVMIFALPAQVLMMDELARGTGAAAVALAVGLTAVRLLPMTVNLMPLIRDPRRPQWLHLYAVHYIAVTGWIEGNRLLPTLPQAVRLPFFAGLGTGFMLLLGLGGSAGYLLAVGLPPLLSAALMLMTPLYFVCSLLAGARGGADYLAIAIGGLLGPVVFKLAPGFDLLIAGVGGGTLAWAIGRWQRQRA